MGLWGQAVLGVPRRQDEVRVTPLCERGYRLIINRSRPKHKTAEDRGWISTPIRSKLWCILMAMLHRGLTICPTSPVSPFSPGGPGKP